MQNIIWVSFHKKRSASRDGLRSPKTIMSTIRLSEPFSSHDESSVIKQNTKKSRKTSINFIHLVCIGRHLGFCLVGVTLPLGDVRVVVYLLNPIHMSRKVTKVLHRRLQIFVHVL